MVGNQTSVHRTLQFGRSVALCIPMLCWVRMVEHVPCAPYRQSRRCVVRSATEHNRDGMHGRRDLFQRPLRAGFLWFLFVRSDATQRERFVVPSFGLVNNVMSCVRMVRTRTALYHQSHFPFRIHTGSFHSCHTVPVLVRRPERLFVIVSTVIILHLVSYLCCTVRTKTQE